MKKQFAFEKGGEKRLRIEYRFGVKDVKIFVDNELIGEEENGKPFLEGKEYKLSDGSHLRIEIIGYLFKNHNTPTFGIWRDSVPVPKSLADPHFFYFQFALFFGFIGILNILLGVFARDLLSERYQVDDIFIQVMIGMGILFLILGGLAHKNSIIAVYIGTTIYLINAVLSLPNIVENRASTGPIFICLGLIFTLFTMKKSKKRSQEIAESYQKS